MKKNYKEMVSFFIICNLFLIIMSSLALGSLDCYDGIKNIQSDINEGLVGYWDFNQGEGLIAHDQINNNDGEILGATWTNEGKIGNALYFDGDVVDQEQTEECGYSRYFHDKNWVAQGFTPSLNVLTRIELMWSKVGSVIRYFDIFVSIRKELDSPDLTVCSVNCIQIQGDDQWIEFNFSDIPVTPGDMYFIVARIDCNPGFDSSNFYGWDFQINNPYLGGDAWYSKDYGKTWEILTSEDFPHRDFCFKTYGLTNQPPNEPLCSFNKDEDTLVIVATDPDEDMIRYGIDWDNNKTIDQWTEYVTSGTEMGIKCNGRKGTIGIISEDEYGFQSDWKTINSKSKQQGYYVEEKYPLLFKFLSLFFKY